METITLQISGLNELIRDLYEGSATVRRQFGRALAVSGKLALNEIKRQFFSGPPGVKKVTGALQRSLRYRVVSDPGLLELQYSSDSPYFEAHATEGGKTIVPSRMGAMAIPFGCKGGKGKPIRIEQWNKANLKLLIAKDGRAYLKDIQLNQLMFHLKRSVTIPERISPRRWVTSFVIES